VKFDQYANFASAQWGLTMSESEHFSLEKCTPDAKVAVWDKMAASYDVAMGADMRRVDAAIERLSALGAITPDTVVLDIGSGTGAYTLALAKKCKTIYALDSSLGMQKVLLEKAEKVGIKNVISIIDDWKSVSLDALPKFDLVLSSLNTGINDDKSLIKMNRVSSGFCCYVTAYGAAQNPVRSDIQKLVFGRELKKAGGNDIIHPFNIIYGLGYRPELTYAPCEWSKHEAPDAALEAICREFARYGLIEEALRERLRSYIMSRLNERGLLSQSQKSTVGIMIWDTRELS
jgi:Methylase involved in ubiquinone/menaquinone biosynthesis